MGDENSAEAQAVLAEAESLIQAAEDREVTESVRAVMVIVARLIVLMRNFRVEMQAGGFSDPWIEERCAEMFNVFIRPRQPRQDSE